MKRNQIKGKTLSSAHQQVHKLQIWKHPKKTYVCPGLLVFNCSILQYFNNLWITESCYFTSSSLLLIWKANILPWPIPSSFVPSAGSVDLLDSQKTQARHYKTLQEIYKSKKPNKAAVSHLLNLEFESRRRFITSNVLKEQDRPTKILEAYPCFREVNHVSKRLPLVTSPNIPSSSQYIIGGILAWFSLDNRHYFEGTSVIKVFEQNEQWRLFCFNAFPSVFECIFQVLDELQRIIQPNNSKYISEMKDRWESFYTKVQFYGVMKKVMKAPKTLDGGEVTISWFFQVLVWELITSGYWYSFCILPFLSKQWSMPQLCSEPCHCSSHPTLCHRRSWAQAVRPFSMSLRWDLQKYFMHTSYVLLGYFLW